MTPFEADLHTHSPYVWSDYRGPRDTTPQAVVEAAIAAGLRIIAVTDHFSVEYVRHVVEAAERHAEKTGEDLLVLPGVEIRVRWGTDEAHLVAILPPDSYQECFRCLARDVGIDGATLEASELPSVTVHAHPCTVAERVVQLGGICHLAHVDRKFGDYCLLDSPLFDELVSCPAVTAVDVVDPGLAEEIAALAPGRMIISSSDAHSPSELGRRRTTLWLDEPSFAAIADALGSVKEPMVLGRRRVPSPEGSGT